MGVPLQELNDSQRDAVLYCDGPQLVIAGAGSGKTRVITYKIAYLLEQGLPPWNILALTFTNKAANEMRQRIANLVGQETAERLQMGTFHSVFSRIIRYESARLGFSSNFTIYDESDSRSLLKKIIKELQFDDKIYKPSHVHHLISMAKNRLVSPDQYAVDPQIQERDIRAKMPGVASLFAEYCRRLQGANAMDFDDLLVMPYRLFNDFKAVCNKYQQRFQYILVDEYQDTNYAQQQLLLQLTTQHKSICVVGDDAQSIYAFRGANIENILRFQEEYPTAKLFKLEQNYRSTQHIVQAANSLIRKNQRQIPKEVYSQNPTGELLTLKQAYSDKEEATIVCKEIKRIMHQDRGTYSDFAILYRTNAQSRPFEEEMRRQSIPYRIYGGLSFYQRKEIKDVTAYFRAVCNPADEEAITRIINYPSRGIGAATVEKITNLAKQNNASLWQIIENPAKYRINVSRTTLAKLNAFAELLKSWISKTATEDACQLGKTIIRDSGIAADIYAGTDPEQLSRQQNLQEFVNALQDFVETRREEGREKEVLLADFLQEVSLLTDLDSAGNSESRVSLMTIHSAKGLEFPTVFIVGMEENIFPNPISASSLRELEEERRLLYVAITRAERHCIMTYAKNRWRYGKIEYGAPSRFLKDIDPQLIIVEGEDANRKFTRAEEEKNNYKFIPTEERKLNMPYYQQQPSQRQLVKLHNNPSTISLSKENQRETVTAALPEGAIIEHQRFGIGKVIKIEGTGENTKATVHFRNAGTKQLLLKFARYNIIGN